MFPDKLLLTAEGDGGETGGGGGTSTGTEGTAAPPSTTTTNGAATPPWYAAAESLKTSDPAVWESFEKGVKSGAHKDMASLIKERISIEKKLGSALTLPNKEKADEVKAFKSKLVQAGVLPAIPESPDKYELKLEAIPEPVRSNDLMSEFRAIAHEEGLSQGTVDRITGLYEKMFTSTIEPALKYTKEQGEKAILDYATEVGKEPEELKAHAGRWLASKFTDEDMAAMDSAGFSNSPVAIKFAVRAALDTGEDISVIDGMGAATDNEYEDMMKNIGDSNHPDHKMFHAKGIDPQDPQRQAFMRKREQILQRKFGTKEVG